MESNRGKKRQSSLDDMRQRREVSRRLPDKCEQPCACGRGQCERLAQPNCGFAGKATCASTHACAACVDALTAPLRERQRVFCATDARLLVQAEHRTCMERYDALIEEAAQRKQWNERYTLRLKKQAVNAFCLRLLELVR